MNEENAKAKLITPAITGSGWDLNSQIFFEHYFTNGEIVVRGNATMRKDKKFADYLLVYEGIPLAVIEAKDTEHSIGAGMQQAISYASILDVPFAYSTNGKGFLEHDMAKGTEFNREMYDFPSPKELWGRYRELKRLGDRESTIVTVPYYQEYNGQTPRYYQRIAINRTLEAVAKGERRILLVMATGTGKTYTAFQIVHRLREAGIARKVLYLADRNVLVDQTITGDFKPLEKVTTKVKGRKLDSSFEVFFSLYQQLVGDDGEEIFREFDPSFFDLIIVDECHRGSADKDSTWRKILEYFSNSIQIGMTATPKETKTISNIDYFGEPVYIYSLRQGISDGFLAPYKVIRPRIDVDVYGYRPTEGQVDDRGQEIEDRVYAEGDMDTVMVIDERTRAVARKITEYLKGTNRFDKTIVFCVDIDHAERMRQALVNENSDLVADNPKYIMRITGDELTGKKELDNFMDPDEKCPTIVTTSELLTTGVNCKTCKLIVLDCNFGDQGMTKFKQIIGRGTRIEENYGKLYFSILDFRNASRLFADPAFDGDPVQIYEPENDDPIVPPDDDPVDPDVPAPDIPEYPPDVYPPDWPEDDDDDVHRRRKYYVHGVNVTVISERVSYYASDGKLVTESLTDYTRKGILGKYDTLDHFIRAWNSKEKKKAIIDALREEGVFLDLLREESGNKDLSDFDLICHIAYDRPPLTRRERAENVKKRGYLFEYNEIAQKVLDTLLDKFATSNLVDLDDTTILKLDEFRQFGSPMRIVREFGGKEQYIEAAQKLEDLLYSA